MNIHFGACTISVPLEYINEITIAKDAVPADSYPDIDYGKIKGNNDRAEFTVTGPEVTQEEISKEEYDASSDLELLSVKNIVIALISYLSEVSGSAKNIKLTSEDREDIVTSVIQEVVVPAIEAEAENTEQETEE